jgi:hypothetical protein
MHANAYWKRGPGSVGMHVPRQHGGANRPAVRQQLTRPRKVLGRLAFEQTQQGLPQLLLFKTSSLSAKVLLTRL